MWSRRALGRCLRMSELGTWSSFDPQNTHHFWLTEKMMILGCCVVCGPIFLNCASSLPVPHYDFFHRDIGICGTRTILRSSSDNPQWVLPSSNNKKYAGRRRSRFAPWLHPSTSLEYHSNRKGAFFCNASSDVGCPRSATCTHVQPPSTTRLASCVSAEYQRFE